MMKKNNLFKFTLPAILIFAFACKEEAKEVVTTAVEQEELMEVEPTVDYSEMEDADVKENRVFDWPVPDDEGVDVPSTSYQVKYCGPGGTNPFIITFMGGGPGEAGKVFFEMTESEDENKVLRTFTGTLAGDGTFTVKKPANCANCTDDYTNQKFRFNSAENSLLVIVDGEQLEFLECML